MLISQDKSFVDETNKVDIALLASLEEVAKRFKRKKISLIGCFFESTNKELKSVVQEFFLNNKHFDFSTIAIVVFLNQRFPKVKYGATYKTVLYIQISDDLKKQLTGDVLEYFLDSTFEQRYYEGIWQKGLLEYLDKIYYFLHYPLDNEFLTLKNDIKSFKRYKIFINLIWTGLLIGYIIWWISLLKPYLIKMLNIHIVK